MANLTDRLAVLLGVGFLVYGVWMLSVAAALILSGLLLMAGGLWRIR